MGRWRPLTTARQAATRAHARLFRLAVALHQRTYGTVEVSPAPETVCPCQWVDRCAFTEDGECYYPHGSRPGRHTGPTSDPGSELD